MSNDTKVCSKCGEAKPLSEFYKDTSRKDGLNHRCKECDGCNTGLGRFRDNLALLHSAVSYLESEEVIV